jgi:quinol monooxygenase YgiN
VYRSRTEAGCVSHAVYRDVENPLRLVFYEEWAGRAALLAHFAVPASRAFVKAAAALAAAPPAMQIHEAQPVRL